MKWRIRPAMTLLGTLAGLFLLVMAPTAKAQMAPDFHAWPKFLAPWQLAVVVNDADPVSRTLADYYLQARHVPAQNLVHVQLPGSPHTLTPEAFGALRDSIERQLPQGIEALLLVWTAPYAVACNSITSALTLGLQPDLCLNSCARTRASRYFDSRAALPSNAHLRLAMLLPALSVEEGKALIDRGVASDSAMPEGTAYLLATSDKARSSRAALFPPSGELQEPHLKIERMQADFIEGKADVMFYFTGALRVPKLETLHFLPGAIADHLTSTGGDLLGADQMSALRWLQAGATASYGTVSEPCNYPQKFPSPAVLLRHYLAGESAIEAYWKSVAWPAQGLFIGEPLAAPYRH